MSQLKIAPSNRTALLSPLLLRLFHLSFTSDEITRSRVDTRIYFRREKERNKSTPLSGARFSHASIRYASLGASSQEGINYPRISTLSLFVFPSLSLAESSCTHHHYQRHSNGHSNFSRVFSLFPPSSLSLSLLHLMAFRVLSRYAGFTLPSFPFPFTRTEEMKESATLSLYTRRRRRRRLPPSFSPPAFLDLSHLSLSYSRARYYSRFCRSRR